jgi:MtfA peptidase
MFAFFRRRRRAKLLAEPFPAHFEAVLRRNVTIYGRLASHHQARLKDVLRILIAEKEWEGVGGFHITDEVRITIAGVAGLLLIGLKDHDYFASVQAIIVYPQPFRSPVAEDGWEDDGLGEYERDGQAEYRGPVLLNWQDVLMESREPEIGYNLVLHEFAHQLDFVDGEINGTPVLHDPELARQWGPVMQAAFERHRERFQESDELFFSEQAADNETEFFADATEAFFCRPWDLHAEEQRVFELLKAYYGLEPREWFEESDEPGR